MNESGGNHDYKFLVISFSDAIIDPNTMMIEIIYASIANPTMFTFLLAIAIAILAEIVCGNAFHKGFILVL